MKRKICLLLILTLLIININPLIINAQEEIITKIEAYGDVSGEDLSHLDLRDKEDILYTLSFDTYTKWPNKDKLPEGFDPQKILEFGKDPGLNIKKLHELGYTGKGVNIAYVDQPALITHNEYKDKNIKYFEIKPVDNEDCVMEPQMHGCSVLSLLVGKDIGVVPDANVYYFGHPAWFRDQRTHASALYKIIEINKNLPDDKKIRIVGFSDSVDRSENYYEEFEKAVEEAEKNNIMVFRTDDFYEIIPIIAELFKDKNIYKNYKVTKWAVEWEENANFVDKPIYIPTSSRTTAMPESNSHYKYWTNAGLSWGIPYIVGVAALGLQINPDLTKEEIISYLQESSYPFSNGGIINPEGFIELVKKNTPDRNFNEVPGDKDYYYFLYNSKRVSGEDLKAIKEYINKFNNVNNLQNELIDVAKYDNAIDIYKMLKEKSSKKEGILKGIQIFGTSDDVPAFDFKYEVKMKNGEIDYMGYYKTDFFYTTFENNEDLLQEDLSVYKVFNKNLEVSFMPQWQVSRLPLTKGEISNFIKKYFDYNEKIKNKKIPIVNFSNPIFASSNHTDDMGEFLNRLNNEFYLLSSDDYKLYGNLQGLYPVNTEVLGDFSQENLKKENEENIAHFIINSHGQIDNIDRAIFVKNNEIPEDLIIRDIRNKEDNISELRISLINNTNVNEIFSNNYYTLTLWTCNNAYDLNNENISHDVLANGKCVNVLAATTVLSNNGVNNKATLENLKKNNFYYFFYNYFLNLSNGKSRGESFYLAKKAYIESILNNKEIDWDYGNYQFNLNNALLYHNLGLIEYENNNYIGVQDMTIFSNSKVNEEDKNENSIENIDKAINEHMELFEITGKEFENSNFKIHNFNIEKNNENYVISVEYESDKIRNVCFFNPPNGDKIKIIKFNVIQIGKNKLVLEVPINRIELGNEYVINFFNDNNYNFLVFIIYK